jgi:hypothetical protein
MKANPNHPTRGVMNMQRMRAIRNRLQARRKIAQTYLIIMTICESRQLLCTQEQGGEK